MDGRTAFILATAAASHVARVSEAHAT